MTEHAAISPISVPVMIYICLGLASAHMLLHTTGLRSLTLLGWLQFIVRAASAVLLWPLVLFQERLEEWLHTASEIPAAEAVMPVVHAHQSYFYELRAKTAPVPAPARIKLRKLPQRATAETSSVRASRVLVRQRISPPGSKW